MATQIQVRRGTLAQWGLVNPVLSQGEPGFEYDTGKIKVGDGVNTWANLPYLKGDPVSLPEGWDVFRVYNFPDMVACVDGHTYRCINNNVVGDDPRFSQAWVRVTTFVPATTGDVQYLDGGTFDNPSVDIIYGGTF